MIKSSYKSIILFLFVIIGFINESIYTQVSLPNKIETIRIDDTIQLDGILSESFWQNVLKIKNFHQRELIEGNAASERTEVAVLYTAESLIIGVWCYDSQPDKIVAKQMKRDFDYESDDNIKIVIDTYQDRRTGYLLVINPNGARNDAILIDDGKNSNKDWNGVWDCAVKITSEGWFAEIEIPFSTLKFPDVKSQVWGFNIHRNIRSKNEVVLWQGWSRDHAKNEISVAGTLSGLEEIKTTSHIEIKPFSTVGFEKRPSSKNKIISKVGGDINYLITSTLKLNLTANTDFSQVESDKAEINLSRFSISYPEKRDFFLEGKNFFDFNLGDEFNLFYSRQIGIANNQEIPILLGGKLNGKVGKSDLGFLSIQTKEKNSVPSTNFTVLRIKHDVLRQSSIGIILTSKNMVDHYNYVYGISGDYVTSEFIGDKNLIIGASLVQSRTKNVSNNKNFAYQLYLSYPNDLIEYDLALVTAQKYFNPEIGFMKRTNYKSLLTELQINPRPRFISWIHQMQFKPVDINFIFSDDTNKLESAEIEWRPLGFETESGEVFEFNIKRNYDRLYENFEIYDSIFISPGNYWFTNYESKFESYRGRNITFTSEIEWGGFYNGKKTKIFNSVGLNLNKHLNVWAEYEKNMIDLPTGKFSTDAIGTRIEYSFNPKLYTSFFGQWNNEDDEMILNFRLNWIPQSGTDFYIVINETFKESDLHFKEQNLTILAKLIWRFVI